LKLTLWADSGQLKWKGVIGKENIYFMLLNSNVINALFSNKIFGP